jgi:hypothetical protein
MYEKKYKQNCGLLPKGTWYHFKDGSKFLYNGTSKTSFINTLKKDEKILVIDGNFLDVFSLLECKDFSYDWEKIASKYNGVLFLTDLENFKIKNQCYCNFLYITESINNNL